MRIDILTILPRFFETPLKEGVLSIAQEKGKLSVKVIDIRDFTEDAHRSVDDYPFGGGAGMVMKPEPIKKALDTIRKPVRNRQKHIRTILLSPKGKVFDQAYAADLAKETEVAIICGHYEGIDERVRELVTEELSVGDYVLSGGEPAALVVADAVARLLPDVLGSDESLAEESFQTGLLEYPQYTRPREFKNSKVPDVLLSGNHGKISRWRRDMSIEITASRRPDLLAKADLTEKERTLAERLKEQQKKETTTENE